MIKKLTALVLTAAAGLSLIGCGSVFNKEYVSVSEYVPPVSEDKAGDGVTVTSFEGLKDAILDLVALGAEEGIIRFDPGYDGDSTEDMASACWEIRTQDALCAYYVENIAYELSKIVNYYEASVHISYAGAGIESGDVVRLRYTSGVDEYIKGAFSEGKTKLAVLIGRSSFSAEEMESFAHKVYSENPGIAPATPKINVNMFSGLGSQRLYELNISYGLSGEEFKKRQEEIAAFDPFSDIAAEGMSDAEKAQLVCRYLMDSCSYYEAPEENSIYSALINKTAGSEGLSFAYSELCRRLGIECRVVKGQRDWNDYSWCIVKAEGYYYHVDVADCVANSSEAFFMVTDELMWQNHRWDLSAYPVCSGAEVNKG